jgi:predicted nucleic acid-binding protein
MMYWVAPNWCADSAIGRTPDELLDRYLALARFVKVDTLAPAVSRDPDDDQVIATAVAAQADLIVSGDLDLLDLGHYRAIPIVAATTAIARIGAVGR